jgi:hypothetical protein
LEYEAAAERLHRLAGLPEGRVDTELARLSQHPADALAAAPSAVGSLIAGGISSSALRTVKRFGASMTAY